MKSIIVHDRLKVERFYRFIMNNDLASFWPYLFRRV